MYSSVRDRPAPAADDRLPEEPGSGAPGSPPPPAGRVSRNVVLLGVNSLLTDISSESVNAVLPLYLTSVLGFSPLGFGLFDGIYQGTSAVLRVASGMVADRRRRHKEVATAGYALSAACKVGLLAATTAVPTAGVLLLDRTGKGIRTAPRDALISLSSPAARLGEAFGIHRALDTLGAFIGPILAFALLSFAPGAYDSVFVVSFCVALLGLGVITFFVRNPPAARALAPPVGAALEDPGTAPAARAGTRRLLAVREFRLIAVAGALLSAVTVSDAMIYLVYQRRSGMEPRAFPLLFVGTALAYLLLAVPLGRLSDRIGRAPVFLAGHGLLLGSYAVLRGSGPGPLPVLFVLGLLGAYYAATDGVLMAMASAVIPEDLRGSGLAWLTTATIFAKLGASLLFGLAWKLGGYDGAVSWFLAGLAVALPVAVLVLSRTRSGPHPDPGKAPAR